jgi:hypothetical protein
MSPDQAKELANEANTRLQKTYQNSGQTRSPVKVKSWYDSGLVEFAVPICTIITMDRPGIL